MFWNVRVMPPQAMRLALSPLMVRPSNVTLPWVGMYTPVMTLNTVVLPAPLGPISPISSPSAMVRSRSHTAFKPPNCMVT